MSINNETVVSSELPVDELLVEAMEMLKHDVRGQHSNNKVIRLCIEIKSLRAQLEKIKLTEQERLEAVRDSIEGMKQAVKDLEAVYK